MTTMQAVQQQPQTAVRVVTQQQAMVPMPTNVQPTAALHESHKKIIRGISIAEIVLGILSMICGAVLTGMISNWYYDSWYYYLPPIGQGLWCGVWVLVAGAIGVVAGGVNSNSCKVNTHMGFAIVGCLFAGTQFILDIITSFYYFFGPNIFFIPVSAVSSFSSLILCIVSAVYSCKITSSCCQDNSSAYPIVYTGNPQPVIIQGVPGTTQGYVLQGCQPAPVQVVQQPMQPVMMDQQNLAYVPVVQQQSGSVAQSQNVRPQASQIKPDEPLQGQASSANNGPPAYY